MKDTVLKHPRNEHIRFNEDKHQYFYKGEEFQGVTSLINRYTAPFDKMKIAKYMAYRDRTSVEAILAEWDHDRQYGKDIDSMVDALLHFGIESGSEIENFKEAIEEKGLTILTNEWVIYDEDIKRASAIDLVCEKNGQIVIVDLKSMKKPIKVKAYKDRKMSSPLNTLPDSKYYKQSLQVGIYKYWLEKKYNLPVSDEKYVLRIRPDFYEWISLMDVENEIIKLYDYEENLLSNTV